MNNTPRTDAFIIQRGWSTLDKQFPDVQELIEHARQLERELALAEACLEHPLLLELEAAEKFEEELNDLKRSYDALEARYHESTG